MGYTVAQLGEKEGFDKKISFVSAMDDKAVQAAYDSFVKGCSGVRRDHLPLRCPVRRSPESGMLELQFDDRNLSYNFDTLMAFISQIISEGMVKAAKLLDGGRIGGTAYIVMPGQAKKFELIPRGEVLARVASGEMAYADALVSDDGVSVAAFMDGSAARAGAEG